MTFHSMRPQAVLSRHLAVEGLFDLIKRKPYKEITIIDICMQGGISRQTFYRNFRTKEDIIIYYIENVIAVYIDKAVGHMESDVEQFFGNIPFTHEFLAFLMENHLMYLLKESVFPLIRRYMDNKPHYVLLNSSDYRDYTVCYLANTMISILETWILRDFRDSEAELSGIMREFMLGIGNPDNN